MIGSVSEAAARMNSTYEASAVSTWNIHALTLRVAQGTLTYAFANFGIRALNLFLLPLYTRFLSPSDYGIVSLAEIIAAALAAVLGLGLDAGVNRLYFQYAPDHRLLSRYMSSCLRFAAIWTVGAVSIVLLLGERLLTWAAPRFTPPFYPYIAMAISAAALLQIIQFRLSLYQIQGRSRSYGIFTISIFLTTTGAVIALVVFLRWGAFGMLLGKLIAAGLAAMTAIHLMKQWTGSPLEWKFVRETLPLSFPLVPHYLMALCLVAADRLILEHYRSLEEVGLYSLAYTLGMTMYLIGASIGQAWQPIYYETARDSGGRWILGRLSSGIMILLIAIAIVGIQISQHFTRLLDSQYLSIGRLIPWIIGSYLLHAFFGFFQLASLQAKKSSFIFVASGSAFALNLALNLWWIPLLGMYGAAYATFVAYGLEALLMYYYAQRVFFLPYDWPRIFAAMGLLMIALGSSQLHWNGYAYTLISLGMLLGTATMVLLFGAQTIRHIFKLVFCKGSEREIVRGHLSTQIISDVR
jgi:O-antigen/teichoic acid export membrane protein